MKYNLQEIMMYAVIGVEKEIVDVEATIFELQKMEQTEQVIEDMKRCELFHKDLIERLNAWNKLDDWLTPWEDVEVEE